MTLELNKYFERCYVVTLQRRPDRYRDFCARIRKGWPFVAPERWRAVDGHLVPHPKHWKMGGGAWGCFRSHLGIIERCLNENVRSVLLLEDDALPCEDFTGRVSAFLEKVPADWGMIYLGGQFLKAKQGHAPEQLNDQVVRPYNVNRTHAFALSREGMRVVYRHLCRNDWHWKHHIDHHLGRLHQSRTLPVYCPTQWLVGQASGQSNISGKNAEDRFWQPTVPFKRAADQDPTTSSNNTPFVAIVGLHSSGSSVIAGVCHHLGVHLGNRLGGFYGKDPDRACGFEADGLAKLCEKSARFPRTKIKHPSDALAKLRTWIYWRQKEASVKGTIAGGKYPHLCRMGEALEKICGNGLLVIDCDRPLDDSIASLQRRQQRQASPPPVSDEAAERVQRWLWDGKQELLRSVPPERQLKVSYEAVLADPRAEAERIAAFLKLAVSQEQFDKAASCVDPSKQHIGASA